MRVNASAGRLLVTLPFLFVAGCDGGDPVSGLREEEQADPDCHEYPPFFVDLEIACFPIGLREVGCGAWALDLVWNPMGSSEVMAPCLEPGFGAAPGVGIGNGKTGNNLLLLPYSSSKGVMAPMSVGRHAGGRRS